MISITVLLALMLDRLLGEPGRWHPLAGFGMIATWIEQRMHPGTNQASWKQFSCGLIAMILLLTPFILIAVTLPSNNPITFFIGVFILYLTIGAQSLKQHAQAVGTALKENNLEMARIKTGYLVSRDTSNMKASDMSRATIESILENGNDAIFAALFWFVIAGIPGVLCYRLVNTLDAMWGYRTTRMQYFGKAAARLDDGLNLISARLTALSYALVGHFNQAIRCWIKQARQWESPNAGPVMAAGAGALLVQLGGDAQYHGEIRQRCILGTGSTARIKDINRALNLVHRSTILWLVIITGVTLIA